jgi:hypothetical protein
MKVLGEPSIHYVKSNRSKPGRLINHSILGFTCAIWVISTVAGVADVRTMDGTSNNPHDPLMGSAGMPLDRMGGAYYDDGISSLGGTSRPSPRAISNRLSSQTGSMTNQRGLSDFLWQWGQFLDHDIGLTPTNPAEAMMIHVSDPSQVTRCFRSSQPLDPCLIPRRARLPTTRGSRSTRLRRSSMARWCTAPTTCGPLRCVLLQAASC